MKKFAFLLLLPAVILSPNKAFCEIQEDIFGFDELLQEIHPVTEQEESKPIKENTENEPTAVPAVTAETKPENTDTPKPEVDNDEKTSAEQSAAAENDEDDLEKMLSEDISEGNNEDQTKAEPQDSESNDKPASDSENNEENKTETEPDDKISQPDENTDSEILDDEPQPDDIVKDAVIDAEQAEKAQKDARDLLSQKPVILDLRDSQKKLISEGEERRKQWQETVKTEKKSLPVLEEENKQPKLTPEQARQQEIKDLTKDLLKAPFGLYWGASKQTLEKLGFEFKEIERKDYTGVYQVINPKQDKNTFQIISAIFGEQDRLWCIFAQSSAINDTPNASEVLKMYHKYYSALKQKYGHDQEFFSPNISYEQVKEEPKEGKEPKITQKIITSTIGNDDFLKELQQGKSSLYATFEDEEIGVTLAVFVDENAQSSISLDYKNLKIMKQEQDENFNNLISDL